MRKAILIIINLALLNACGSNDKHAESKGDKTTTHDSVKTSKKSAVKANSKPYEAGQTLVYENPGVFSTYTEDKMRGSGVVSFQLDTNDRLDIYYPDLSTFGFLVYNEDGSFYTLDMPAMWCPRLISPNSTLMLRMLTPIRII